MRFSPKQLVGAAVVLLSLAIGGVALRAHGQTSLESALHAARDARLALDSATAHAARSDSVAAQAEARARDAAARERFASQHADSAAQTLAVLRERYRVVSAVVPDTCRPIKAAADSALAASDTVVASLHAALSAADDRAAFLQIGLDTTRDALSKLRAASRGAVVAMARVEAAEKPNILSRFLKIATPRVGFGVSAGLDMHGIPNAVTGITLGWNF